MEDISRMRSLAKVAAKMEGRIYILYEKDGVFNFVPRGEKYNGVFVEYIWYF
jgi:hypothetical protein